MHANNLPFYGNSIIHKSYRKRLSIYCYQIKQYGHIAVAEIVIVDLVVVILLYTIKLQVL